LNKAYQNIIAAKEGERRDLFLVASALIGTTIQNIEKDFWVCWTLDALFHRLKTGGPRLLFKGGTSLSKGYNLISRFSEDIDITVFRDDLGESMPIEDLEKLSNNQRNDRLKAIKSACQNYIDGTLRVELSKIAEETMKSAKQDPAKLSIVLDPDDPDKQSILINYPSVAATDGYLSPSVKIESGAKSALDPNEELKIAPYLRPDIPGGNALEVTGVTTIKPQRTFMDKILILHGLVHYYEAKGTLRGNGRMSRHYYDVYQLMNAEVGKLTCSDTALVESCVRHAQMFFNRNHTGLDLAKRENFRLSPLSGMIGLLRKDYEAMQTMIFGDVPKFETILESVAHVQEQLNSI
jgi:predicted nucleotidyltransferase component of viral defense system